MIAYRVYPVNTPFTSLADATDCAKLDRTSNEEREAWIEDENENVVARFKDGEQV